MEKYRITVRYSADRDGHVASVAEVAGCEGEGSTRAEAIAAVEDKDPERSVYVGNPAVGRFLRDEGARVTLTDRIDRVLLHPGLGFVLFLALMTIVFQSLFAWADPVIQGIEM